MCFLLAACFWGIKDVVQQLLQAKIGNAKTVHCFLSENRKKWFLYKTKFWEHTQHILIQ